MDQFSEKGEIPEFFDDRNLDLITSLVSTFESNDLHARSSVNFKFDKTTDMVYLDIQAFHNGNVFDIPVFGFKKEKMLQVCRNIQAYFMVNDININ